MDGIPPLLYFINHLSIFFVSPTSFLPLLLSLLHPRPSEDSGWLKTEKEQTNGCFTSCSNREKEKKKQLVLRGELMSGRRYSKSISFHPLTDRRTQLWEMASRAPATAEATGGHWVIITGLPMDQLQCETQRCNGLL